MGVRAVAVIWEEGGVEGVFDWGGSGGLVGVRGSGALGANGLGVLVDHPESALGDVGSSRGEGVNRGGGGGETEGVGLKRI